MARTRYSAMVYAHDIAKYGCMYTFDRITNDYGLIHGIWMFWVSYRTHKHIRRQYRQHEVHSRHWENQS